MCCRTRWKPPSRCWAAPWRGIVNPINPLLEAEQISAILRETGAKVVVTLRPFPKTDLAQKVAEAVKFAPNVKTVLEVDLLTLSDRAEAADRAAPAPEEPDCPQGRRQVFHAEAAASLPTG
jgi:fatty-acyl-CoA synthase